MEIIIKKISKKFIIKNIDEFLDILHFEKYEYWTDRHFIMDLSQKFQISLAALNNNRIIGYIIASRKGEIAYIHKFMVHKQYRCSGVGKKLQTYFEKVINSQNIDRINLSLYKFNIDAKKFYEKSGFNIVGEKLDSITNKELYIMSKEIYNEDCYTST